MKPVSTGSAETDLLLKNLYSYTRTVYTRKVQHIAVFITFSFLYPTLLVDIS
jgi:hypothetical protein